MHYMVIESFRDGSAELVYRRFAECGRMMPEGLTYVTSWVTMDRAVCYQVVATDDPALLETWMGAWSDLVDFEVIEVMSSAAAATPSVHIRASRADELETLQAIERTASKRFDAYDIEVEDDDPTSLPELRSAHAEGRVFVATLGGEPVGWYYTSVVDGQAHLMEIDVHPDHGRQGVGSALLEHAASGARAAGFTALTLTTFRHVPFNAPFYAGRGFEVLDQWGPEMEAVRVDEDSWGLSRAQRCVMRRVL